MIKPRVRGASRLRTKPRPADGHGEDFIDESFSEIGVPDWNDGELPDPIRIYSFAVKQLMILAAACPASEVRAAAARFLCAEFAPVKPANGTNEKAEFIGQLRRAIAGYLPGLGESIEVEEIAEDTSSSSTA
jgi:hypothetical protein